MLPARLERERQLLVQHERELIHGDGPPQDATELRGAQCQGVDVSRGKRNLEDSSRVERALLVEREPSSTSMVSAPGPTPTARSRPLMADDSGSSRVS